MATDCVVDVTMKKCHMLASLEDYGPVLFVNKDNSYIINLHYNLLSGVSHVGRFLFRNYLLVERKTYRFGGFSSIRNHN